MNTKTMDSTTYVVTLAVMCVLVAVYINPPAGLRESGLGKEGFGVARQRAPSEPVPGTLDEQLRAGTAKTWTEEQYMLNNFTDLRDYVNDGQYRAPLDPKIPQQTKNLILEDTRRLKEETPARKPVMFGRVRP